MTSQVSTSITIWHLVHSVEFGTSLHRSHDFLVTKNALNLPKWFHNFLHHHAFFILLIAKSTKFLGTKRIICHSGRDRTMRGAGLFLINQLQLGGLSKHRDPAANIGSSLNLTWVNGCHGS